MPSIPAALLASEFSPGACPVGGGEKLLTSRNTALSAGVSSSHGCYLEKVWFSRVGLLVTEDWPTGGTSAFVVQV